MMLSPIQQAAQQAPNNIAVLVEGQALSYADWAKQVSALSYQLHLQGVKQGSIVAAIIAAKSIGLCDVNNATQDSTLHGDICNANNNLAQQTLSIITLYWACIEIGAIFFPINGRFSTLQIQQLLLRLQVNFIWQTSLVSELVTSPNMIWLNGHPAATVQVPELTPDSQTESSTDHLHHSTIPKDIQQTFTPQKINPHIAANIILTSGSSGTPKAAVHSLMNHMASAQGSSRYIPLNNSDRWLLSLPLFHIGGLAIVNRCAIAGACIVIKSSQNPLEQQLKHDAVTHVSMVPTQAVRIINQAPQALNQLKALLLGGGIIEPALIETLAQQQINTYTSYGMTEMSSQITTAKANVQHHHGRALPHRQLKLVDGVIWVKGECLFQGYLVPNAQQQLQLHLPVDQQGWFCTQDRGQLNQKGQLILLGRADNMFICGGENIQPEEIESVLMQHPLVAKVIVFGQADTQFGLLPAAIIDYATTALPIDIEQQLAGWVSEKLANFKRPRHWYAWPNITETGLKLNRQHVIAAIKP
ncbi:o-succinylbenzoate--CoA ligase [Shewanella sp. OMA3-2]|uniref:o-succinylbenzoate--CoA ligase n=1 Tax=Shewanella sp. OMA3-2 TaxID=2908650 RepID=UPI001F2BFAA9|nr:o-succinylbenzoate--CoA ligase [Shewanella sp. OMA3-2]UJF22414.1 o-succinylbenzoate--CoA ligase [Shewanella sp. OMA3-2]